MCLCGDEPDLQSAITRKGVWGRRRADELIKETLEYLVVYSPNRRNEAIPSVLGCNWIFPCHFIATGVAFASAETETKSKRQMIGSITLSTIPVAPKRSKRLINDCGTNCECGLAKGNRQKLWNIQPTLQRLRRNETTNHLPNTHANTLKMITVIINKYEI